MSIEITPEREFIITSLVGLIRESVRRDSKPYSTAIEFGLTELARVNMRRIVQEQGRTYQAKEILDLALRLTKKQLIDRLQQQTDLQFDSQFDFDKYLKNVQENLKFPAKEVAELSGKLVQSKRTERVSEKVRICNTASMPLEITEVGLRDSVEGLLVTPLLENFVIELDRIKSFCEIEGDWFPFKIALEEFVFILDDDGTLFLFTENLPSKMVSKAKESIQILADQLYRY